MVKTHLLLITTTRATDSADEVAAELECTHHDVTDQAQPDGYVQGYGVLEYEQRMKTSTG